MQSVGVMRWGYNGNVEQESNYKSEYADQARRPYYWVADMRTYYSALDQNSQ